jgi:hypothetical protein
MRKAQPWISQIENPNYGKWTVATLLDLAKAFDSDLEIKFRPFSLSLYELSHQDQQYFNVPSFEEELPELELALSAAPSGNISWGQLIGQSSLGAGYIRTGTVVGTGLGVSLPNVVDISKVAEKRRRSIKGSLKGAA